MFVLLQLSLFNKVKIVLHQSQIWNQKEGKLTGGEGGRYHDTSQFLFHSSFFPLSLFLDDCFFGTTGNVSIHMYNPENVTFSYVYRILHLEK